MILDFFLPALSYVLSKLENWEKLRTVVYSYYLLSHGKKNITFPEENFSKGMLGEFCGHIIQGNCELDKLNV